MEKQDIGAVDTVLLDVDGTLIDSNYWHTVAWQQAFADSGVWQPAWRIHTAIGMGGDRLIAAVAGDTVEAELGDTLRAAWKKAYEEFLPNVKPFPKAAELITELKRRGLTVVLASSGNPDHLAVARKLLDADDAIDAVTTGEDADSSKPSGELFQIALGRGGGRRAVVIGDSPWDIRAAADLPAPVLALACGGSSRDSLTTEGALAVFDDPADLLDHLDDLLPR